MDIRFNVTGAERKALVVAISEILGQEVVYEGAPSFAYSVGVYRVNKDGTLNSPDDNVAEFKRLLASLKERSYIPEAVEGAVADEPPKLIIKMPIAGFTEEAIENLNKIIASKETLIKKALGADSLPIEISQDVLTFPWFISHGIDGENDAYARFVVSLCQMAKTQKRVTAKEKESENDKFTMRLFLIRLGFVGPECKDARAILLRNLKGNGSFKNGQRPEKHVTAESGETATSAENQQDAPTQDKAD